MSKGKCFCICRGHEAPALAVDAIVVKNEEILLIKRANKPFRGKWALVGGFVECGETTENTVKREVKEETGLNVEVKELLGIYSTPDRDPRGHVISICYIVGSDDKEIEISNEVKEAKFFSLDEIKNMSLAFDHEKIIRDYEVRKCSVKNAEV